MAEKLNENLAENDGMLEDEAMLKGVAGGSYGCREYQKACPHCGTLNNGIEIMGNVLYSCSNPECNANYE